MDIHYSFPDTPISLSRVGVKSLKVMIKTKRSGSFNILFPEIDIYVDLPSYMKGINLSRSVEGIRDILRSVEKKPIRFIEDFCGKIARRVLEKHEYASRSEVRMKSDYFVPRSASVDLNLFDEKCKIYAYASCKKINDKIKTRKFIGASVVGLTVCPCAREVVQSVIERELRSKLSLKNDIISHIMRIIPIPSHNQRCLVKVFINSTRKNRINVDDIISIIEESVSAPTFSILKRQDEANVIINAHRNPKFTEDVVRGVIKRIIERYPEIPESTFIYAKCTSFESIHKYNITAEKAGKLEELKKQIFP
ncbi:MAG: GTP cyclohydrolase MptA [Candidatus Odinarchaeia archaeon]